MPGLNWAISDVVFGRLGQVGTRLQTPARLLLPIQQEGVLGAGRVWSHINVSFPQL